MSTSSQPIPIFIGYDPRERAATNVLIDSLYQNSSVPLAITPLVTPQLEAQGPVFAVSVIPNRARRFPSPVSWCPI